MHFWKFSKVPTKRYSAKYICFQLKTVFIIYLLIIYFSKLCSLLATFINAQEIFQRDLNLVVRVIWRGNVNQCQINVEITLFMSTLKFTSLNDVKLTLSNSTLILTTVDNVETMLSFSTLNFRMLMNVEKALWVWLFSKNWKQQKDIFELQQKDYSFD